MEKNTSDIKMSETGTMEKPEPKKRNSAWRWILTVVVVIVVILLCLYGVSKFTNFNIMGIDKAGSGKWQAVFLSNGQVYFGNVTKNTNDTVVLKNIYYLQVTTGLQPTDPTAAGTAQQGLSLVKLGNELHGPKDEMLINKAHVVFIEDLKADGKVVAAIDKYIEDQKK